MDGFVQGPGEQKGVIWEDFWVAMRMHWLVILVTLMFTVLGAYATVQLLTEQYVTSAEILVKLGRENAEVPTTVGKGGVLTMGVRAEEINSNIQLLLSRKLLEETLDRVGLESFYGEPPPPRTSWEKIKHQIKLLVRALRDQVNDLLVMLKLRQDLDRREAVILTLQRSLSVERARSSDVISINLRLPDPDLGVRFLDQMLAIYLDHHIEIRKETGMSDFFGQQLDEFSKQIAQIETERQRVMERYQISDIETQRNMLLERLHKLYARVEENQGQLAALPSLEKMEAAMDKGGLSTDAANVSLDDVTAGELQLIEDRIAQLQMDRIKSRQRFIGQSGVIENIDAEVAQLQMTLNNALTAHIDALRERILVLEQRMENINKAEELMRNIDLKYGVVSEKYVVSEKRLQEARISEKLDQNKVANIAVLSPPVKPIKPVYPRKLLVVVLAIPLGLLVGVGLALMIEYLGKRIRRPRDLMKIEELPFLGGFRINAGMYRR